MGKCAVITGASRGIGAGIAEKLASENWNLALCARQDAETGKAQCAKLKEKYGIDADYFRCDISCDSDRENTITSIIERFGSIDALINNAGVAPKVRADILEMTGESFDFVMNINLRGSFFFTQLAARQMAAQRSGTIINIGSCSATVASISRGEYCISKAGIGMMTKLFAVKMAEFGVNVYEIRPGIIETDMMKAVPKAVIDPMIARIPLRRLGQPEDIANAFVFLASDEASYITGVVLSVDGMARS